MNGDAAGSELPELTDEDVKILDIICKRAARSNDLPSRAIFDCYDQVLEEQGISSRHDPVLFRWISRLSEPRAGYPRAEIDFVRSLRVLLEAHGITVVDDTYDYDDTEAWQNDAKVKNQRRVSFDDARYEETWLSNHTQTLDHNIQDTQNLSGVPLHTRDAYRSKHARSLSQDRVAFPVGTQTGRTEHAEQVDDTREEPVHNAHEQHVDNVYYPSHQELEEQADVFLYTTMRRSVHRCFNIWRARTNAVQHQRQSDEIIAADNDYRMLMAQAFSSFRIAYIERVANKAREAKEQEDEQHATEFSKQNITRNLLQHMSVVAKETRAIQVLANRHILEYRFFNRWKVYTCMLQRAAALAVLGKCYRIWLDRVSVNTQNLVDAAALYERNLARTMVTRLVDRFRCLRAQQHNNTSIARRALTTLSESLRTLHDLDYEGQRAQQTRCLRSAFRSWRQCLNVRRLQSDEAADLHTRRQLTSATHCIKQYAELIPRLQQLRAVNDGRLAQRVLHDWLHRVEQQRLAKQFAETRLTKNALVSWNDKLRIQSLLQRINARVVSEMLYRLMLEERYRLCKRLRERRLMQNTLGVLLSNTDDMTLVYERRSAHFAQESQRRTLTGVFQRMLLQMREREDAERAANELSHARLLPGALAKLIEAGERSQEHNKWARDAAFYVGTKKIVDKWRRRTEQSKQDKRRLAYDQVRNRIKARLMQSAFAMLRARAANVAAAQFEADRLIDHRAVESLRQALLFWQQRTAAIGDMDIAAVQHHIQKLRRSALRTIETRTLHVRDMTELSIEIRGESDMNLMATTYKRLRATGFALARIKDSSNIFHERLQQRHRLQMLRHFAQLAAEKRAQTQDREPDSPSIRPASRAASRSDSRPSSAHKPSPVREATGTPAYLRTPSRAKRTRFKAIPTPAPFTPFTFTPAYLTTTPAPQQSAFASSQNTALGGLTPQITPFNRKLRANGIATDVRPASILRSRPFGRSIGPGTDKSVRFASRFQRQQPSSVIQEAE